MLIHPVLVPWKASFAPGSRVSMTDSSLCSVFDHTAPLVTTDWINRVEMIMVMVLHIDLSFLTRILARKNEIKNNS